MRYLVITLLALTVSGFSICNNPNECRLADDTGAMRFVKLVQKRYYLVHRLEKPIKSLLKFYEMAQKKQHFTLWDFFEHHHHKHALIKPGASEQFKHPIVKHYMREIEQKSDIQAIHKLWSDFFSYKYIESDLFVRETIVAIVLLYKDIMLQLLAQHMSDDKCSQGCMAENRSRDTFADENIDESLEVINESEDLYDNFHSMLNLLDESYEEADFVINNNMRFYHIQRLFKSIIVLSKLMTKHEKYNKKYSPDFTQLPFENAAIVFYIDKMKQTQSLDPLFRLWHCFVSYKYIDDAIFLKEFVTLLLLVHKQIIVDFNSVVLKEAPSPQELIELYEQIASMPISDLLNSLDVVVDQCIEIIEKYELDSSMSWKAWFKKYWWMPPVVVTSVIVNFFLKTKSSLAQTAH